MAEGELIPSHGPARWRVLVDQALADGVMDAAVLVRYESATRPEKLRWNDWITGQLEKVTCGLAELERRAMCPDTAAWFEQFAKRESMEATRPPAA